MALAASLHGYFLRPTRLFERVLLFGGAIVLIKPGLITDLIGFAPWPRSCSVSSRSRPHLPPPPIARASSRPAQAGAASLLLTFAAVAAPAIAVLL